MKLGGLRRECVVLGLLLLSLSGWAQTAPSPAGSGAESAAEAEALMNQGRCAEALALTERALSAGSGPAELQLERVDALLCVHRTVEALAVALPLAGSDPRFAMRAGIAEAKLGGMKPALEEWIPLFDNPAFAPQAYEAAVEALVAAGKEERAGVLLDEALRRVSPQTVGLLRLAASLRPGSPSCLSALAALQRADPGRAESYKALIQVYQSAEGPICQEALEGSLPALLRLKERSERIEASSMKWMSGNSYIGPSANIASGTQGYGAGMRDTATSEGGRNKSSSTPPRVVVDMKLEGKTTSPFVLDTLSDVMLISPKMAKKLHLRPLASAEYCGIGQETSVKTQWVLLRKVEVGPLTITNVPAMIIDPRADYWDETGGVFPLWLLRHYGLHYDRRHSELTLLPSGTPPAQVMGPGTFEVNVLWYGKRPLAYTAINGRRPAFMQLGTAFVGSYVELRRVDDLGITVQTSKYGPRKERGLHGLISSGVADEVPLDLGKAHFDLPTVLLADLCPDGGVDCAGTLGRNILDFFDIFLDYPAGVLALKGYEKGR